MKRNVLILGAGGQIGTELTEILAKKADTLVITDIRNIETPYATFINADVRNEKLLREILEEYQINEIYLMAALLYDTGEKNPDLAWDVNMKGLLNVLNLLKNKQHIKLFWPSSIAVFGPTTPKENTPQHTVLEPTTMYGITKLAGERLCEYYHLKFGIDVRSLRYPGLISYKAMPGGGTTDYAIEIFYQAIKNKRYTIFLKKDQKLPMMYMPDALNATLKIMEAPAENVKIRSSYNVTAFSFTPEQLVNEIRKYIPEFQVEYKPDYRQKIAESWTYSIDDSPARKHWKHAPQFSFAETVKDMLQKIREKIATA